VTGSNNVMSLGARVQPIDGESYKFALHSHPRHGDMAVDSPLIIPTLRATSADPLNRLLF
jgi:hypothetical protein